jgi:hypothetical protein
VNTKNCIDVGTGGTRKRFGRGFSGTNVKLRLFRDEWFDG